MLYIIIIIASVISIIAGNLLFSLPFSSNDLLSVTLSTLASATAVFLIDAVSALIIRRLTPARWYKPNAKIFNVSKKERNFYNKLRIKEWKDAVPELGGFTSFHKNRLDSISDSAYLERFITEANYGVIIHLANGILGIFIAFIPFCRNAGIFVPVFIVNLILSLLPVFILRHTLYTLLKLYNRSVKNSDKQKKP